MIRTVKRPLLNAFITLQLAAMIVGVWHPRLTSLYFRATNQMQWWDMFRHCSLEEYTYETKARFKTQPTERIVDVARYQFILFPAFHAEEPEWRQAFWKILFHDEPDLKDASQVVTEETGCILPSSREWRGGASRCLRKDTKEITWPAP